MIGAGKDILIRFQRKWQRLLWLEILLLALGPAALCGFFFQNLLLAAGIFFVLFVGMVLVRKPWRLDLKAICAYIDQQSAAVEYSSGLLLVEGKHLSGLAQLQQRRVSEQIGWEIGKIRPAIQLQKTGMIAATLVGIGLVAYSLNLKDYLQATPEVEKQKQLITFTPADSSAQTLISPELIEQRLSISYPAYTNLPNVSTSEMNVKAVEGSRITWEIYFDQKVDSVSLESMGIVYPMKSSGEGYKRTSAFEDSGFYNFRFKDSLGNSYVSVLYSLEVLEDRPPVVEIHELDQFSTFNFDAEKNLRMRTTIQDDFGIAEASIIATVSKGSGESVKFREERFPFNEEIRGGSKNLNLSKEIDLDELKMEPGDELYFYVEASDLKQPHPNISRSETYFAVIRDTASSGFAVEGTMGVDLMPAYFRSQRQLIIDTEKLISKRSELSAEDFNSQSNDLGFDQKVLRLRYGEFMGDESEAVDNEAEIATPEHEYNEEDPLAAFSHRHDGDNEHNLVEEPSEKPHDEEESEDPLHEYLHNHDDPEESTLFTESLKTKLRKALNEMWDAELHLRMFNPEKSLPYQYRALELIQEIKNAARIYVHRIGFDPPPIKEESRLTGDLKEVRNVQKREDMENPDHYLSIRKTIGQLEKILTEGTPISEEDRLLFEQAGTELATKAVEEPGKYLQTLQGLKKLTETKEDQTEIARLVLKGLIRALPEYQPVPGKASRFSGKLNDLLLMELESYD